MNPVRVGIVGFGKVGRATAGIIAANSAELKRCVGAPLVVTRVCCRSPLAPELVPPGASRVCDWRELVDSPDVDIAVECMGGTDIAGQAVLRALTLGKPVVTANKNLMAQRGTEIHSLAADKNLPIGMEATVAGGVPVLRAISDGMAGDRLLSVYGIVNGTTNYILTQMEREGLSFEHALEQAQQAGYAEADPTLDIDGIDARDKLCILARLAFHGWLAEASIATHGIRNITLVDLCYARQLDSTVRLLAHASRLNGEVEVSVRPWLVRRGSMLANIQGANNAVCLVGERAGRQMFSGPGAGPEATGTAVVADLVAIGRSMVDGAVRRKELSGFRAATELKVRQGSSPTPWYLRLTVRDRPGIIAEIARIIADLEINIDSVFQQPNMPKDGLSFVITVEAVPECRIRQAAEQINRLEFMLKPTLLMPIRSERES
jgi:homoserine dehydrogenase